MPRALWLLIAAGACVLGSLVFLMRQVDTPSTHTTSSASDGTAMSQGAAADPVTKSVTTPSRTMSLPGNRPFAHAATPSAPVDNDTPPPAADTQNLQFGGTQLRAQTAAVEPLVVKCLQAEVEAGRTPSGTAMLTYIVAKHGDKFVVEDTGLDEDKTTLKNEALLTCLRETSRSMQFVGLPKNASGLVVSRRVSCEAGKLTENKHVGFSYLD